MNLSQNAIAARDYCAANARPSVSCGGKRAVFMHWPSLAAALGLPNSDGPNLRACLDALGELHAAGILSHFDHGPGTYGHTSTIFND